MNQSILTDKELHFLKRFIADSQSKWNQYYSIFVAVVFLTLICWMYFVSKPVYLSVDVSDIKYETNLAPAEWVPKAFEKFARLTDRALRDQFLFYSFFFAIFICSGCVSFLWRDSTRNRIIAKLLCAHWEKIEPGTNSPDDKNPSGLV